MPFIGLGLHFIVALFFAVHALRSGQQLYWLIILFSFPMLGSIVYFLAIYLPDSRLERGARKVVAAAAKTLNPTRELKEAHAAFDYTPTAQNQMRLAAALLEAGQALEAAQNYDACLKGPFAADLEIRLGASRAYFACERYAEAITHLEFIRKTDPAFRAEQVSLLLAQSLAGAGRSADARAEFEAAVDRFGSFESRAEYAIWAAAAGDTATSARLQVELQRSMDRWNRHTRELNKPLLRRLNAAFERR
ncbi:hypothetical protein [Polaromonas sp. YR568]|uniref:hypothetical protein n=1 Tax=Polaromonas sp. YR568 TaxID=1855301 RepID=UPI00398BD734